MTTAKHDPFGSWRTLPTAAGDVSYHALDALSAAGVGEIERLPVSIRVLLESLLRNADGFVITDEHVARLAAWNAPDPASDEVPFKPARVVLQDFTGVPAVVDLAALRDGARRLGGDPKRINPLVPCDLVIDHSVQVDHFARGDALRLNLLIEFDRNRERYEFLKWGQSAFDNFRVVPPGAGIVHQVNLEYLASVVMRQDGVAYPDSLVGTDSHTTMINGLGVVGWGVGGIEAEAVMLGQPVYMLTPSVVGFKLTGELPEGATATDLVLRVTQILREAGVVGQFVEFFGPGLASMALPDRATIANMAPEYGATMGFFPVDGVTLDYLRMTGRSDEHVDLVERYCKAQGLWREERAEPRFTRTIELDLNTIEPALAGPKRPQDLIRLAEMRDHWHQDLEVTFGKPGAGDGSMAGGRERAAAGGEPASETAGAPAAAAVAEADPGHTGVDCSFRGQSFNLRHGHVVIAAITSCTNTSNPSVMLAAGLLAKKAVERGLTTKPWVKTSLAPGSRVVTDYYHRSGLDAYLDQLGFNLVGYGCTTCIGNSGPLPEEIAAAVEAGDLVVASVLSGNRNFEGRINPHCRANYLASPPLVVAYALAGTVDIDLTSDPLGAGADGEPVYLRDIWPAQEEVRRTIEASVSPEQFKARYADIETGDEPWQEIELRGGELYDWKPDSTYIRHPPFFRDMTGDVPKVRPIAGARVLGMFGDSVTTDHISPAGAIASDSPAGRYLIGRGVEPKQFNSYGSRRGNHEVMMRGTFANIRVRNRLAPGTEGGYTMYLGPAHSDGPAPGAVAAIYDAAMAYQQHDVPLIVLAGRDYGMGSSRDWAAKGTYLLGVRAVVAESYERIHRSNLVGMGVLPLQFKAGDSIDSIGLTGRETFDIALDDAIRPGQEIPLIVTDPGSREQKAFATVCRIDTPVEAEYYRNGGILHTVLRKIVSER